MKVPSIEARGGQVRGVDALAKHARGIEARPIGLRTALPALLSLTALLSSCPSTPSGGAISGSVSLGLSLTPSEIPARDVIAGQFIVKFKARVQGDGTAFSNPTFSSQMPSSSITPSSLTSLRVTGSSLTLLRSLATGAQLYRLSSLAPRTTPLTSTTSNAETVAMQVVARLMARGDVEYTRLQHSSLTAFAQMRSTIGSIKLSMTGRRSFRSPAKKPKAQKLLRSRIRFSSCTRLAL